MIHGFCIGKFYPFHLGHMYLLDVALANCDQLTVWVCDKIQQSVLGSVRANWIRELYPTINVMVVPDTLDDDDTEGWAKYTLRVLNKAPDVVFTSEDYGERYAALMRSKHVLVDRHRACVPISGTIVRGCPADNFEFLAPPQRAYYAKRVVCVGAESTGTTTLASALASHYKTTWVPEYGREYWTRKVNKDRWETNEFIHIASEQNRRNLEAARHSNRVLICDTDAFATTIWHERYVGSPSWQVNQIASTYRPDLYILTGDDIPFVQDGTRDGEKIRHWMHCRFQDQLRERGVPYLEVYGDEKRRIEAAIQQIDKLLV
jgi:NadR type nicotinamide-nucleotide adenylyltransferase